MTSYEFEGMTHILITTLISFGLTDALIQRMLEGMNDVAKLFVEQRDGCICFIFKQGKTCAVCEKTVYGELRLEKD